MNNYAFLNPATDGATALFDARGSLAALVLVMVAAFIVPTVAGLAIVLLYVLSLHRLAGSTGAVLAGQALRLGWFLVLIMALNGILVAGAPVAPALPFVSREGLVAGVYFSLRVLVFYYAVTLFLSVNTPESFATGVASVLRPVFPRGARRAAMYSFLVAGFLPLFADEVHRVDVAQRFRGGGLRGGLGRKLRGARLLLIPLIVSAVHRSGHLAVAVEVREIERAVGRLLRPRPIAARDIVLVAATAGVIVAAWLTRRA